MPCFFCRCDYILPCHYCHYAYVFIIAFAHIPLRHYDYASASHFAIAAMMPYVMPIRRLFRHAYAAVTPDADNITRLRCRLFYYASHDLHISRCHTPLACRHVIYCYLFSMMICFAASRLTAFMMLPGCQPLPLITPHFHVIRRH